MSILSNYKQKNAFFLAFVAPSFAMMNLCLPQKIQSQLNCITFQVFCCQDSHIPFLFSSFHLKTSISYLIHCLFALSWLVNITEVWWLRQILLTNVLLSSMFNGNVPQTVITPFRTRLHSLAGLRWQLHITSCLSNSVMTLDEKGVSSALSGQLLGLLA